MTASPDKPWVLLRKRHPQIRFATGEAGRKFYDQLRFNAGAGADEALFGPGGEAWYCGRFRWATWIRDDARRMRAPQDVPDAGEKDSAA